MTKALVLDLQLSKQTR